MASYRKCFQFFRRYLLLGAGAPLLLSIFLSGGIARAQIVKSTFIGTVRDASGAVVPGATITVKNLETNVTNTVPTDSTGDYIVPFLNNGMYSVTAEKSGFKTTIEPSIKLDVAAKVRVDLTLQVGQTTQSIEVQAAAPLVQTDTSTVDTVMTTERLRQLPLEGRDYQALTQLAPTAVTPVQANESMMYITGLTTGNMYQTAGMRGAYANYTVDGINTNNLLMQTQGLIPSLDSIGEYKVETHNFSAEYGRGAVQYVVTTRAGTNKFHGTAYEYVRNEDLDARDYFLNEFGGTKPEYRYNQFGATLGGPILLPKIYNGTDKTFFFFGYEGTRYVSKSTAYARWPDPAWLTGDFSSLLNPPAGEVQAVIYDPATTQCNAQGVCTRQAFPGNIIPPDRLNPVAVAAAQYLPAPESLADLPSLLGVANTSGRVVTLSSPNYWNLRIDHNISERNRIYARYMQSNEEYTDSSLAPLSGSIILNRGRNMMFGYTRVFSPTIVNEARIGYNRSNYGNLQEGSDGICLTPCKEVNYDALIGIKNIGAGPLTWGLPAFGFTNYSGYGGPVDDPFRPLTNTYQISDNLIVTKGHHSMKMGFDLQKMRFNMIWGTFNRGSFAFSGQFTSSGSAYVGGNSVADFMLGLSAESTGLTGETSGISHSRTYGYYFQDDYRITSKLTLNLGMRYEYYAPWKDQEGNFSLFDYGFEPGSCFGYNCPPGHVENLSPSQNLYNPNYGDWGPRVGFAYSPFGNSKTVVRGSYAIIYSPPDINDVVDSYFMPPTSLSYGVTPLNPYTDLTTNNLSNLFPAGVPVARNSLYTNTWPLPPLSFYGGSHTEKDAAIYEWQFSVERQLAPSVLLELGYVGSHSIHGQLRIDYNQARLDYPGQLTSIVSREPYPSLSSEFFANMHLGIGNYQAGTLRLEKRFSHGLSMVNAFTWAKTLDDYGNLNEPTGFWAQNAYNLPAEWGLPSFDARLRFTSGYVLEVPYGRGRKFGSTINRYLDGAIGGWQVSGITTFQSGNPIVPRPNTDTSNTGTFNWTDRMNQVAPITYTNIRKTGYWYSVDSFALPQEGTFGTAARGDLTSPGLNNWDLGISKYFSIKESAKLQFRCEMFNAWNHAQFESNAAWGGGGITYSPTGLASGAVGKVLADTGPRSIQLALRLEW